MSDLSIIQKDFADCNLLIPSATSIQLNPYYKCTAVKVEVNTDERAGDIFKVGSVKTGEKDGKGVFDDVYALCKPLLMRMATAAGIQFSPVYTNVTKEDSNTYVGHAYGALRISDGAYKTQVDTKRICLDDEEAKYRLEFMDKSIQGITDYRAAKAAAAMFKGKWVDTDEVKNGYKVKKYVIDDEDRQKYIERSILVNMTLLRKTASEKAQTGAILRVIRALLGVKGTYTKKELSKPFAVATVAFTPDFKDADVRVAMLQQGMNSMSNMFGTSPNIPPVLSAPINGATDAFDPEAFADNPAFTSEQSIDDDDTPMESDITTDQTKDDVEYIPEEGSQDAGSDLRCAECGEEISEKVFNYSSKKFGRPLCYDCQRGGNQ